jgi:mannitol-specific phosphotransferase system IIBC component
MVIDVSTKINTAGGIFLSVLPNVHSDDVLRTVVLAAVGAIVSFIVSVLLRILLKSRKR